MEKLKTCTTCGESKPLDQFRKRPDSKGQYYFTSPCIACSRKLCRENYRIDGRRQAMERYRSNRLTLQKLRDCVFEAYGKVCACCGESEEVFLTVDHADGDGAIHRKKFGQSAWGVYRDIVNQGFPKKYRILCMNCNWATRFGHPCFHQQMDVQRILDGMGC